MIKTSDYKTAKKYICDGKVGVIPTDTLYGLCSLASNISAVGKMYNLKKRDNKPGTLVAATIDQLVELGLKKRYLSAVEAYWPGAISIVIPTGKELGYLHLGKQSLAVRIPDNQKFMELLTATGPLITTSANLPGEPPATNLSQAKKYFGNKADFYLDGGELNSEPSTIIRVVDDAIEVLREGSVRVDEETGRLIK